MSSHFNANQYDDAFDSKRLQNWQIPKTFKERPSQYHGFSQVIANDRGHILPGVQRSQMSPWGEFLGTWDMPRRIPGNVKTYMARSNDAVKEIQKNKSEHEELMRRAATSATKIQVNNSMQQNQVTSTAEHRPQNPSPNKAVSPPPQTHGNKDNHVTGSVPLTGC